MLKLIILAIFLALALCQDPQKPQSIGYLAMGYNIYQGNPLSNSLDPGFTIFPLFNFTYTEKQTSPDGNYLMPDNVDVAPDQSCVLNSAVTAISGMNSYVKSLGLFISTTTGLPDASFSASASYSSMQQSVSEDNTLYTLATGQCSVYAAVVDPMDLPQMDNQFIQDVIGYLDQSDSDSYYQFLDSYGTHYVQRITMGSRLSVIYSLSETAWESLEAHSISVTTAAQASFDSIYIGENSAISYNTSDASAFSNISSIFQTCTIGTIPPPGTNTTEWSLQANTNPMPIQYSLVPLSELFSSASFISAVNATSPSSLPAIQKNLATGLAGYCQYLLNQGALTSCAALSADPPLPIASSNCALCTTCGGIYTQLAGTFDLNLRNGPDWFMDLSDQCGGFLNNSNPVQEGVNLCCVPELSDGPDQGQGSCRMCSSCGGNYNYSGGSIMINVEWPNADWENWMGAYGDSCAGNIQVEPPQNETGYSLCCDQPTTCAFCTTCGGDYPYENGDISVDQNLGNFFDGYGDQCGGPYGDSNNYWSGAGERLCCSNST